MIDNQFGRSKGTSATAHLADSSSSSSLSDQSLTFPDSGLSRRQLAASRISDYLGKVMSSSSNEGSGLDQSRRSSTKLSDVERLKSAYLQRMSANSPTSFESKISRPSSSVPVAIGRQSRGSIEIPVVLSAGQSSQPPSSFRQRALSPGGQRVSSTFTYQHERSPSITRVSFASFTFYLLLWQ